MTATATAASYTFGFHPDAGTDWSKGDEPLIAAALDKLAKRKHINIYGLSGARTPEHSVEVGGFANDPHTKGAAGDIAVNGQLRASASSLSAADLASVGLYRPFAGASEINHVQVKPESRKLVTRILDAPGDFGYRVGRDISGLLPGGLSSNSGNPVRGLHDADHSADQAIGGAASDAAGAARDAVTGVFTDFFNTIKNDAPKAMLFFLLAVGGLAMTGYGTARLFGVQQPVKSTFHAARRGAMLAAAA